MSQPARRKGPVPRSRKVRRRAHPGMKVLRGVGIALLLVLLVAGVGGYAIWRHMIGLIQNPTEPTLASGATAPPTYTTLPLTNPVPEMNGIRNILLLGVDDRREVDGETYNNSDVMMIVTVDMDNNVVKLTSLQRDLAVYMPGRDDPVKLTETHALGGASSTLLALNENLRLSLTDYVSVNINEAERLIDIIGGIELFIDLSDSEDFLFSINECIGNQNVWFPERGESEYLIQGGMQHLDGRQAVAYARVRHGSSDYRRMARQRAVLQAVFDSFMRASLTKKYRMVEEGMKCIYTTLHKGEISKLALNVVQSMSKEIRQKQVPDPLKYNEEFYETTDYMIRADLNGIIPGLYGFLYNDVALPFDPVRAIPGAPNSGLPLPAGIYRQEDAPAPTTATPVPTTVASTAPTETTAGTTAEAGGDPAT